jgi:ferredoxin
VITIDFERCDGCGACVEICPNNAIFLVEGKAEVDGLLCQSSEVCLAACPTGAISLGEQVQQPAAELARVPGRDPEPELMEATPETLRPAPIRSGVLPVVGAALAWVGREIVPRLADTILGSLDRRAVEKRARKKVKGAAGSEAPAHRGRSDDRRRQHRRRRRGG